MIDKFVAFGGLHHAIERHYAAKSGVFENDEVLVPGFLVVQHLINGKVLPKLIVQRFVPQRVIGHRLLLC